ncbi:uncharacterized protein LOC131886741 [Tigriopus californicus]|uniref:uncharacterized protein LOC131886741 n=1 Tax=Tigriopus californicus TaxID=6832 RepID=UPI0027DA3E70|nr:uncharacterized protein LOC131886741 [Tigriopus californicus]
MIQMIANTDDVGSWRREGHDPPPEFLIPPPPLPDFLVDQNCQSRGESFQDSLETCDINTISNFGLSSDGLGLNSIHSISLFLVALFGVFTLSACIAMFVLWRRYHKDSRLHYLRASVSASSSFKPSPMHSGHTHNGHGVEQPLIYDDAAINFISSNNLVNSGPVNRAPNVGVGGNAQNTYHVLPRNQMSIDSFQSSARGGFYPVPSEMETDTDSRIYEEVQQNQNDPYPPNTSTLLMATPKSSARFGPMRSDVSQSPTTTGKYSFSNTLELCHMVESPYSNVIDEQTHRAFSNGCPAPSNFDYSSVYYHPHQTNRTSSSTGISSSNSDQSSNLNLLNPLKPSMGSSGVSAPPRTPFIVRNESGAHLLNGSNLNMNRSQNNVRNHMGFLTSLLPNRLAKKGRRQRRRRGGTGEEIAPPAPTHQVWPNQFATGDSSWLMTSQPSVPVGSSSLIATTGMGGTLHLDAIHQQQQLLQQQQQQPLLPLVTSRPSTLHQNISYGDRGNPPPTSTATTTTPVNYGQPNMAPMANKSTLGRMPNPDDILPQEAWTDFTGAEDWSEALTMKRSRLKRNKQRPGPTKPLGSVANCDNVNNNPNLRPHSLGSQITSSGGDPDPDLDDDEEEEEESFEMSSPMLEAITPQNGNLRAFQSSTSNSNSSSNTSAQR